MCDVYTYIYIYMLSLLLLLLLLLSLLLLLMFIDISWAQTLKHIPDMMFCFSHRGPIFTSVAGRA